MKTLRQLRLDLGWTSAQLAKEAGVGVHTAAKAERGSLVKAYTAKAIADALGRAYGKEIKPWEIEGLNIQ